ncbi:MAG: hypothetical protein GTO49_07655 [Anaerolineae bacterium]|nr:hypothetical protein [Anaerolineae bacterium]
MVKEGMHGGINVLLDKNGLAAEEIDQVVDAGASGNYLPSRRQGRLSRDRLDQFSYNPK